MKILYIVDKFPYPGEPKRDKYPLLFKSMVGLGHSVCMIAHSALYRKSDGLFPKFVKKNKESLYNSHVYEIKFQNYIECIFKYPLKIKFFRKIFNSILHPFYVFLNKRVAEDYFNENGKPDIIHVWGELRLSIDIAVKLKKQHSIPIILNFHSDEIYYGKEDKYFILKKIKYVDSFAPVSKSLNDLWVKKYGSYLPDHRVIIGNPVNPETFTITNQPKIDKSLRIFHLSKLSKAKNIPLLLAAFNKVLKGENAKLILGGPPKIPRRINLLIDNYGLSDQIEYVGNLTPEEVSKILNQSDLYVQTTIYETFGIPVAEALMTGTPVLSTKSGGPDTLINSFCGSLSEADDIESFSNSLSEILEELENFRPEKIRTYAINNFGIEKICKLMEGAYSEILRKTS